jgi:hypothetical protein
MVRVLLEGNFLHLASNEISERPANPQYPKINHRLKVSILPCCLHMDQDAYIFLLQYIYSTFGMDVDSPKETNAPKQPPEEDFFFGMFTNLWQ